MSAKWKSSPTIALVALLAITAVWGSTFLVVQDAVERMPVMDFLAVRFTAATLVMLAIRPTCLRGMSRAGFMRAAGLGVMLGMGYITQTYGLKYTSASVSGFITGMFVVLTPVMSWVLFRRGANRNTIIAVVLATVGLGLISLNGWSVGVGELLTLVCALFFALQIVGLGEWSAKYDTYSFAVVQIGVVAVISLAIAVPGGIALPPDGSVWGAVALTAVLATAAGFLVQTWAQSLVSPTRVAVVMTMELVFAGLFGVFIGGNQLTPRILGGAACVLAAMFISGIKTAPAAPRLET
ncbi:MAG: DMT family transporter [Dehalococcoidia bacterium]|nr:MAG: DMT family transporter [Dehalococcoidia bacterium]